MFAGRVLEPLDLVQIAVIQRLVDRYPKLVELAVIEKPSGVFVDGATNCELHLEAVPV